MNKSALLIFYVCLGLLFISCSPKHFQGKISWNQEWIIDKSNGNLSKLMLPLNSEAWIKRTDIIIHEETLYTVSDRLRFPRDTIFNLRYKYSFYNYDENKIDDYYSFEPNSTSMCSYQRNPKSPMITWHTALIDTNNLNYNINNSKFDTIRLPDTLINQLVYKKVRLKRSIEEKEDYLDYLFVPNVWKSNVTINPYLSYVYMKGMLCTKFIWTNNYDSTVEIFNLKIERAHLTKDEKKIFKAWKKNTLIKGKNYISLDSANKSCIIQHQLLKY